jgi:hypothetical protein
MAIMTMGRRRYALAEIALSVVGAAILPRPDRGAVTGGNTFTPSPVASGTACRQVPEAETTAPNERLLRHVLDRNGYGPRPSDIEQLRQMGVADYLVQQLNPNPTVPHYEVNTTRSCAPDR